MYKSSVVVLVLLFSFNAFSEMGFGLSKYSEIVNQLQIGEKFIFVQNSKVHQLEVTKITNALFHRSLKAKDVNNQVFKIDTATDFKNIYLKFDSSCSAGCPGHDETVLLFAAKSDTHNILFLNHRYNYKSIAADLNINQLGSFLGKVVGFQPNYDRTSSYQSDVTYLVQVNDQNIFLKTSYFPILQMAQTTPGFCKIIKYNEGIVCVGQKVRIANQTNDMKVIAVQYADDDKGPYLMLEDESGNLRFISSQLLLPYKN